MGFITKEVLLKLLAEFTAAAMVLTLGCSLSITKTSLFYGFGWGFAYAAAIHIFGFLCGAHVNPSVTICATILGHMDWKLMLLYILVQFLGSLLGFGLAYVLFIQNSGHLCLCITGVKEWRVLVIELIITSILLLSFCAIWDKRSGFNFDSVAVRVGLIATGLILASESYTGGSMNFFRTFIPGLCQLKFKGMWPHIVAHFIATAIVPLLWRFVMNEGEGGSAEPAAAGA